MSKLQGKSSLSLARHRNSESTTQSNPLEDALRMLDDLYNLRLVDRIARPRQKLAKQAELSDFGTRLQALHEKMMRIRSEILEITMNDNPNTNPNQRGRSLFGSTTNKTVLDWRKYIRLIESRYNEVLIQGSFKHCKRVCQLLGLKFLPSLELILVEEWAHQCLENRRTENCC